eukprot:6354490-Amphidinium_carterae.1
MAGKHRDAHQRGDIEADAKKKLGVLEDGANVAQADSPPDAQEHGGGSDTSVSLRTNPSMLPRSMNSRP